MPSPLAADEPEPGGELGYTLNDRLCSSSGGDYEDLATGMNLAKFAGRPQQCRQRAMRSEQVDQDQAIGEQVIATCDHLHLEEEEAGIVPKAHARRRGRRAGPGRRSRHRPR